MTGNDAPFLCRTVTTRGMTLPCRIHLPGNHDGRTPLPALLCLHGSGERGFDDGRQARVGLGPALLRDPDRFPALVVMPQAPPDRFWAGAPADAALAAFQEICADYRVDTERFYLTGMSMGGHGAWYLAYRHPRFFAAVAPVCGWVVPSGIEPEGTARVVPEADGEPYAALARRLASLPVWIVHGDLDPVVPVAGSRLAAAALRSVGAPVHYTELGGVGHNAWDAAYASAAMTSWLFAQRLGGGGNGGPAPSVPPAASHRPT